MSRPTGAIVLLVAVTAAVVATYVLRLPGHAPSPPRQALHSKPRPAAGAPVPSEAAPAKVAHGQLQGGAAPAPAAFDVTLATLPMAAILDTDLRPQDLPPLDRPPTVSGSAEGGAGAKDEVLGLVVDGVPRAYPLAILNYHWAVNDVIDGRAVVVFWDPVAGAATAFQATVDGRRPQFGATGKFAEGNSLFYEAQTTSLFLPMTGRFVTGPLAGRSLRPLPVWRGAWASWLKSQPETRILSRKTGFELRYDVDPFATATLPALTTQADPQQRLLPTEWVLGFVTPDKQAHCCPLRDIAGGKGVRALRISGARVDRTTGGHARAMLSGGVWPQQVICRYFAWYGAYPNTEVTGNR